MSLLRIGIVLALAAGLARPQDVAPAPRSAFEVAAVRRCQSTDSFTGISTSGGRLTIGCLPVRTLISMAYIEFADGRNHPFFTTVTEGPAWIDMSQPPSDWYAINAEAEDVASPEMMRGPMLQALLEDRFRLKVHHETRQVRLYALTVDKRGSRLKAFDGSCTPIDFMKPRPPEPAAGEKPICSGSTLTRNGRTTADMHGMTLEAITDRLGTGLERRGVLDGPLIDRTGLTGLFDLHLEFAVDGPGGTAAANDASENLPSIFSAVQEQLGLRIERTTGPREFLVIDHVERPSEN